MNKLKFEILTGNFERKSQKLEFERDKNLYFFLFKYFSDFWRKRYFPIQETTIIWNFRPNSIFSIKGITVILKFCLTSVISIKDITVILKICPNSVF